MPDQEDGCYPRVNGGMIQSDLYNGMIVSVVGKVVGPTTLQTADGTNIELQTEFVSGGLQVNPDMCIEIVGQVNDPTMVTAFVTRELSADMDLGLYNQMIEIQKAPTFSENWSRANIVTN